MKNRYFTTQNGEGVWGLYFGDQFNTTIENWALITTCGDVSVLYDLEDKLNEE